MALVLIREAIAFSTIASVNSKVGLYASRSIALITAIAGGRPGVISAATATTAELVMTLVKGHGQQYLLTATVLAGLLQIGMGLAKLGFVLRFVSKSVMAGFVITLGILIFMAQLSDQDPTKVSWLTLGTCRGRSGDHLLFPDLTKSVPSPLVTIVVLTALTLSFGWDARTVGDMSALPDTCPYF